MAYILRGEIGPISIRSEGVNRQVCALFSL